MLLAGVGIAFGVALLWAIIVQCLPKVAVWVAFILASVLLLVAAVLCFTQSGSTFSEDRGWVIFFGIIFVLFFILLVSYVCFHRKQVALCGCFMEVAADCLRQNLKAILHLLLFAALSFLFILLLIYEYLSFSSASEPTLKGLYYTVNCNGLLLFLLVMQGVWGFSFFRDASNSLFIKTTTLFLGSQMNGTSTRCTCSATLSSASSLKTWAVSSGDRF